MGSCCWIVDAIYSTTIFGDGKMSRSVPNITINKYANQRCYSCGKQGKTTDIGTSIITCHLQLCNTCLQWLKNKLRGF